VSFAEAFRAKAAEYEDRARNAPSLVMRAWYEGLQRSYALLAADEDRHYSGQPYLPRVEAAPMQPTAHDFPSPDLQPHDLAALDELEAELAAHFKRERAQASPVS
jgi:hypothetical protein